MRPASWETTIGGFVSTTATTVEPAAALATHERERDGRRAGSLERRAGLESDDGLVVEVDDGDPVRRLDVGDHAARPASRSETSAEARRAAAVGAAPPLRAAR